MPCPKCHSHYLWDDNLAWGCLACGFFTTGDIRNSDASRDRFLTDAEYKKVLQDALDERDRSRQTASPPDPSRA